MLYPRKVGKPVAEKAFEKAVKRSRDPMVIVAGARRLAEDPNLPEKQFIPHPSTWLNRDGWNDEPMPARGGAGARDQGAAAHEVLAGRSAASAWPTVGELSA